MPPVAHVAHRPTAIPLALSPFTPPPMQPQTDGSTLFPALQTPPPTLPPVGPANCSTQNRPSSPCPSRLIPHSPLAPAAIRLPRFRALALFGRLPSARVDGSSCRRPKTCTEPEMRFAIYRVKAQLRCADTIVWVLPETYQPSESAMMLPSLRSVTRRSGCSLTAALKMARASSALDARASNSSTSSRRSACHNSMR